MGQVRYWRCLLQALNALTIRCRQTDKQPNTLLAPVIGSAAISSVQVQVNVTLADYAY